MNSYRSTSLYYSVLEYTHIHKKQGSPPNQVNSRKYSPLFIVYSFPNISEEFLFYALSDYCHDDLFFLSTPASSVQLQELIIVIRSEPRRSGKLVKLRKFYQQIIYFRKRKQKKLIILFCWPDNSTRSGNLQQSGMRWALQTYGRC